MTALTLITLGVLFGIVCVIAGYFQRLAAVFGIGIGCLISACMYFLAFYTIGLVV